MSKTLRKAIRDINTHQRHLEAVAKKIDVLRRRTASKGRKKRKAERTEIALNVNGRCVEAAPENDLFQ